MTQFSTFITYAIVVYKPLIVDENIWGIWGLGVLRKIMKSVTFYFFLFSFSHWIVFFMWAAQSAGAVEYTDCFSAGG